VPSQVRPARQCGVRELAPALTAAAWRRWRDHLHKRVEAAIRSTPPGEEVLLTVCDLEELAGHVAGEANHAKNKHVERILSGLFEKIEESLA
jgi:hypothetical protein